MPQQPHWLWSQYFPLPEFMPRASTPGSLTFFRPFTSIIPQKIVSSSYGKGVNE